LRCNLTLIQAYALQAEIARLPEQRGEKVIGYKVGCTFGIMCQRLAIAGKSGNVWQLGKHLATRETSGNSGKKSGAPFPHCQT
jgi:hypothetical protein